METKYEYNGTEQILKIIKGNEQINMFNVRLVPGEKFYDNFFVFSSTDVKFKNPIAVIDKPENVKLIL